MKKLILFDIDGTIVTECANNSARYIPDSLTKAIVKLQQNGHLCFINTGRSFGEVDTAIRELPFDGYICGCGTYILYQGKELLTTEFPVSLRLQIIEDLQKCNLDWLLEGTKAVYYSDESYTTHIGDFMKEHKEIIPEAFHIMSPDRAKEILPDFNKFCLCLPDTRHDFAWFQQKYANKLDFIDRKGGFYEVIPKGHSKASGIQFLEDYFAIPHENTIAIGDSTNDLPMLEYASYSIAMGNSLPDILPYVDYVTDTVENDGIYKAMQHLHLI